MRSVVSRFITASSTASRSGDGRDATSTPSAGAGGAGGAAADGATVDDGMVDVPEVVPEAAR